MHFAIVFVILFLTVVSRADIYAGGRYTTNNEGTPRLHRLGEAKVWQDVGITTGSVNVMACVQGQLYIGGHSLEGTTSDQNNGQMLKFDGSSFSYPGAVDGENIYAMETVFYNFEDPGTPPLYKLYLGGDFHMIEEVSTPAIGMLMEQTWVGLCDGLIDGNPNKGRTFVSAITASADGGTIYAAGNFNVGKCGDTTTNVNNIVAFAKKADDEDDAMEWVPLGAGIADGIIKAMQRVGDDLYVAGSFSNAGGAAQSAALAKWNGNTWSSIGNGEFVGEIRKLLYIEALGMIAIGGSFTLTTSNGQTANFVLYHIESDSFVIPNDNQQPNDAVNALLYKAREQLLYLGGEFTSIGLVSGTHGVATYNFATNNFLSANGGVNHTVTSLSDCDVRIVKTQEDDSPLRDSANSLSSDSVVCILLLSLTLLLL